MNLIRTVESTIARATERTVISWPVFSAVAIMSVVLHLFASPDLEYTNLGIRAVFAGSSVIPMFAIIFLAVSVKLESQRAKAVLVVTSFFVGGAIRGVVLWSLLNEIGILDRVGLGLRLLLGSWNMGLTVFVFGYLWNAYLSYVASIREKSLDNQKLQASLDLISSETRLQNQNLVAEISQEILDSLQNAQGYSTAEQIAQLEELIQNKVKPLQESLERESQSWLPEQQPRRISFADRVRNLKFAKSTPASWLVIPLPIAAFPIVLSTFGLDAALLFVLLGVAFMLPVSAGLLLLIRRYLSNSHRWLQVTALSISFLIAGTSGGIGTYLALLDTDEPDYFLVQAPITFFVYAWSITLGLASRKGLLEVEAELSEIRRKLRWAIARASMVDMHNRRRLIRYLHGPIQSSIQSTIISLQKEPLPKGKENAFRSLKERVQELKSPTWQGSNYKARFAEIQQLWSGLSDISIVQNEGVQELLEKDLVLADHASELVQNVTSSLIRGLSVATIEIQLSVSNINQLQVLISWSISSDAAPSLAATGLSKEFRAACISEKLDSFGGKATISLLLPGMHYLAVENKLPG